jgi:hypothetical protein
MILTKDNLKLGLVLGLIGPILGLLVVYLIKYSELAFADFFELFINTKSMITAIGSLSLLANVVLFTLYVNTHRDNTAKGIFIVTLIYGIAILLLKVVI